MEILIIPSIFGLATAAIASSKGRNALGWFFAGFFLGLIGLIIIIVVSNLKEENAYRESVRRDNRRLREQMKQERMKNQTFQRYAATRLDNHDTALGLDTRSAPQQLAAPDDDETIFFDDEGNEEQREFLPAAGQRPPPVTRPDPRASRSRMWHYQFGGDAVGPVSEGALLALLASGQITLDTLVWCEELDDWQPARRIRQLRTQVQG